MLSFFVYGSLKPGFHNYEKYLKDHDLEFKKASVSGNLFELKNKNYPALKPGNKQIEGYVFQTDDQSLIAELDKLENYFENDLESCEYHKTLTNVHLFDSSEVIQAYVYFYNDTDNEFNKLGDLIEIDRLNW